MSEKQIIEILACRISELEESLEGADILLDIQREQIEHRDGVIAALQQNIADLTCAAPPGCTRAAPALPAAALKPAKLPRYF